MGQFWQCEHDTWTNTTILAVQTWFSNLLVENSSGPLEKGSGPAGGNLHSVVNNEEQGTDWTHNGFPLVHLPVGPAE